MVPQHFRVGPTSTACGVTAVRVVPCENRADLSARVESICKTENGRGKLGGFEQRDNLEADRPPSRSREGPPDGHVSVRGPRPSSISSTVEPQVSRSLVIWAVPKLTAPFLRAMGMRLPGDRPLG